MGTVYTIREALIDYIPLETGIELKHVSGFQKAAGGAPALSSHFSKMFKRVNDMSHLEFHIKNRE